jgi:hypothetical protein
MSIPPILKGGYAPEVLILTSLRQQVAAVVVHQQVAAVVVHQQVAAAVVHQQVVAAALEQAAVVVQRAFAGKILPTELCLPLQVAIASSFYLPPKKFCSYYILILNRLSSFLWRLF